VADSQAPTSRAIRVDVKRRIKAGESDEQIRQAYVDTYGESILLTPQDSGVSLLVWILPIVVLAMGATGIVLALRRNRAQPHLQATEADQRLVEREHGDG
jgi:cytochrome c-type biogenesis protein CcmH